MLNAIISMKFKFDIHILLQGLAKVKLHYLTFDFSHH